MDAIGNFIGAGRTVEGDLTISFAVNDNYKLIEQIDELKDQDLLIEISTLKKKHSAKARKYMWKLCDLMAKTIGSDKDSVYISMLRNAGVFDYLEIPQSEINKIRHIYRYIEEIDTHNLYSYDADGNEKKIIISELRCYEGMHSYDSKQLSDLINEIVANCNSLNIPTITEEELKRLAGIGGVK